MMLFLRERQALAVWVLSLAVGIGLAFAFGIIRYTNFAISLNSKPDAWSKVGFGANGELATIGLVAVAYVSIRVLMGLVGGRAYR